jgi:hypothetical protein
MTPRFAMWFEEVTGLGFPHLTERCGATLKKGSRYEGWGCDGTDFVHRFQPVRLIAYHFDAAAVVDVLGEHVRATRVDARVEKLHTSAEGGRGESSLYPPSRAGVTTHRHIPYGYGKPCRALRTALCTTTPAEGARHGALA